MAIAVVLGMAFIALLNFHKDVLICQHHWKIFPKVIGNDQLALASEKGTAFHGLHCKGLLHCPAFTSVMIIYL